MSREWISLLGGCVIPLWFAAHMCRNFSVRKSVRRTRLTAIELGLLVFLLLYFALRVITDLAAQDVTDTILDVFLTYMQVYYLRRLIRDEDDWFNQQKKRFKRSIKRLRSAFRLRPATI